MGLQKKLILTTTAADAAPATARTEIIDVDFIIIIFFWIILSEG